MTKMDVIKTWLAEYHPDLHLTEGERFKNEPPSYCLIGKHSNLQILVDKAIHRGENAQVIEVDFDRKPGIDWLFSYHNFGDGNQGFVEVRISNPNYFLRLEEMLKVLD